MRETDKMDTQRILAMAATDVGRQRDRNEDSVLADSALNLFVVADGMGGHAAGEVASKMATEWIHKVVTENREIIEKATTKGTSDSRQAVLTVLENAVQAACFAIHERGQAEADKRGMGTTSSVLLLSGERGFIAHVGDSRIYLLRDNQLHQLTEDHSLQNELVRRGKIRPGEIDKSPYAKFKNAVTRAVGAYESVETDTFDFEVTPGDQFLLCSDGLHFYLQDGDVAEVFKGNFPDTANRLVAMANAGGGHDNISAVVVRVEMAKSATQSQRAIDLAERVDVLKQIPLFRNLSYKEIIRLLNVSKVKTFRAKSEIIREGEAGDEMFVILAGKIRLSKSGNVILDLERGAHFGEMAFVDKSPRSATATAEIDCRVLRLKRDDFFEIIRKEPVLATKMLWAFVQVLSQRLRKTTEDLSGALEAVELTDVEFADDITINTDAATLRKQ